MISKNLKSDQLNTEVFVWIWLPDETTPVVAGRLTKNKGRIYFNYGRSYLERIRENQPCISIYEPELPLNYGILPLAEGLDMPGSIRDASPDAWGRKVIIKKLLGCQAPEGDTSDLSEFTYLLESGSDRIGALDFQKSPTEYEPRLLKNARIEELSESINRVEEGKPLTPDLDQALFHGTSIGGARPKALIEEENKKFIGKFSLSSDLNNMVKSEYVAMRLASLAGLDVSPVKLVKSAKKDVLLVERFDRKKKQTGWSRHAMVSALTILGLDEMMARYCSYEDLAEIIRNRFEFPKKTLRELFSRLVFNILCGNTDDHARNHAAFWDGKNLSLTPAYDICPQIRSGNEATQAMLIAGNNNLSKLSTCLLVADKFCLNDDEANDIFDNMIEIIEQNWNDVCDEAELSRDERKLLWGRQFLNPFSIQRI